jgi:branched-chain amino acid transport system permease protein
MRRTLTAGGTLGLFAIAALLPFGANDYMLYVVGLILVYAMAGLGLTVLIGWAGQIALAHAGFMGIGAYLAAILVEHGVTWPVAVAIATVACAITGVIVGLPAVRLRGMYLAIATLAFGELTIQVLFGWTSVSGGPSGKTVAVFQLFGLPPSVSTYYLTAGIAAAVFWIVCRLGRGPFGRKLKSVRDVPIAASAMGFSPARIKLTAFAVSAAIAGLAGGLFGQLLGFLTPSTFGVPLMVQLLVITFVGGARLARGSLLGAVLVVVLRQELQNFGSTQTLIYSLLLLITLLIIPDGLASGGQRIAALARAQWRGRSIREQAADATYAPAAPFVRRSTPAGPTQPPVLKVRGLSVAFGGNLVIDGIDLDIRPGFTGLLGPNGAGKTTLLNAITGLVRSDSSLMAVAESDLRGLPASQIARVGIARTFQTPQLIGDLTVLQNTLVGSESQGRRCRASIEEIRDLIDRFALHNVMNTLASDVSLARLKIVELVRALSSRPTALLLDEPAAGLSASEVDDLITPLQAVAVERDISVLIIEHDVDLISRLCDAAYVLNFGKILASGSPHEVLARADVVSAYLGASFDAVNLRAQRRIRKRPRTSRAGPARRRSRDRLHPRSEWRRQEHHTQGGLRSYSGAQWVNLFRRPTPRAT